MKDVRQPQQQRSIEKKRKIIESGLQLFAENGYYATTTPQIAKLAGVSTGIVYGYFKDKHDIFLNCIDSYIDSLFQPIYELLSQVKPPIDLNELFDNVIQSTLILCKKQYKTGKLMIEMSGTEREVRLRFSKAVLRVSNDFDKKFIEMNIRYSDGFTRLYTGISTIIAFAREAIFFSHEQLDYAVIRKMVLKMLNSLTLDGRL